MTTYHKIQTVFKRDTVTNRIIEGDYTCPEFAYLANNVWSWSEKVDGTNIRVMWNGESVMFGGKTDNAQLHTDLIRALQEMFETLPKQQLLKEIFTPGKDGKVSVCLYGEGYGAGIQSGGCYRPDKNFVLLDVLIGNLWLQRKDVEDIAQKLGIDVVPVIGEGTLEEGIELVRKGFKSQWGDFIAEGIVARPKVELRTRRGDRLITKIKHCDFGV